MTGSTDSICALSSLLGRVPLFNDGVTSWHAFNRSVEEEIDRLLLKTVSCYRISSLLEGLQQY